MFPDDAEMKWISTEGKQGTTPAGLTQIYDAFRIICYVADGEKVDHEMILKNVIIIRITNGTANPITEHSVSIVTDVISSRCQHSMEEQVQVMKIARHSCN